MTILDHLKSRASASDKEGGLVRSLTSLAEHMTEQADAHLKQIIAQQPSFDLHDGSHSHRVAKNIEAMLGQNGLQGLSVYDLFLLQTASYLHDCAMALPQWEDDILQLAEKDVVAKANDQVPADELKGAMGFEAATQLIRNELKALLNGGTAHLDWLFAPKHSQAFVNDLAERLRDYQNFRNGYRTELASLRSDAARISARSIELRLEFIRRTHHTRIETWIRNLDSLFEERLSGAWGRALAHDLAAICRSHGEGEDFVRGLPRSSRYLGDSPCNPQLAGLLLRLGDIADFSAERAPQMLYRQKHIQSQVSRDHWDVKNQGIDYSFVTNSEGVVEVRYSAYFQVPRLYFLFQEYLNWVDGEFSLYERVATTKRQKDDAFRNAPVLAAAANRNDVRYDSSQFEPVTNLRFSLDQKRILELLMGVKLYKDPFACLRELYQNALDATRCMLASEENTARRGAIEFGLGSDMQGSYVYCRDNGVGMTRDIVSRFFLRVGNSYYRSQEFQRASAKWGNSFTPVSQFGVGILSCFMIGTRLEVLSKPLAGLHDKSEPICFIIDSPHEHFYYRPLSASELELVGRNGTVVKVFLQEDFRAKLHAKPESDVAFWQHCSSGVRHTELDEKASEWGSHIYKFISDFVGDYPSSVDVSVRCDDGRSLSVIRSTTPFDYQKLGISIDLIKIWEESFWRFRRNNEVYTKIYPCVEYEKLVVEAKGVFFSTILGLPKPGFLPKNSAALDEIRFMGRDRGVLIDGISVDSNRGREEDIDLFSYSGILNFLGALRPILSVDRLSVVEWPKELDGAVAELRTPLAEKLVEKALQYAIQAGFENDSDEVLLLWDHIFSKYGFISKELMGEIFKRPEAKFIDPELSKISGEKIGFRQFGAAGELILNLGRFCDLKRRTVKMVMGKLVAATEIDVNDVRILVKGPDFAVLNDDSFLGADRSSEYALRADNWATQNHEFDATSVAWPVVSARLFDRLERRSREIVKINARTKQLPRFSNSISALVQLDPVLIHQRLGTYAHRADSFGENVESYVYKFSESRNNFWLYELGAEDSQSKKERCFIVVFVAPRELNKVEKEELKRYEIEDAEYVKGVNEGWSILATGDKLLNVICVPGRVARGKLVELIPASFWERNKEWTYRFLDGSLVRDLAVDESLSKVS